MMHQSPSKRSKLTRSVLVVGVGLLLTSAAVAQPPSDLTGLWEFQTTLGVLEAEVAPCVYEGTASIVDSGGALSGNAVMTLVNGTPPCPAEGSASVSGSAGGAAIMLQLTGPLGVADLGGEYSAPQYSGSISVANGPVPASGTWSAVRGTRTTIPTLSVVGASVLVLLLASVSLVTLRARSQS